MTWLGSWNNFFWPLLVVVSEDMRPIPVGLASFWQEEGIGNLGHVLAANTMAIVLPLVIFLGFQRYFVQGISLSGLKG
jgi:ABC-type glycerol-3-phosphate transport system permease component